MECRRSVGLTLACLAVLAADTAAAADNKQIVTQARSAYYSLETRSFGEMQCNVSPNWTVALRDAIKKNPAEAKTRMKILETLKFAVVLGVGGSATVTNNALTGANPKQTAAFQQIYGGVQNMLVGFFDTWTLFVRNSPLPLADSEYQLENQNGRWQLSYKEGDAAVFTEMEKDFAIRELKVETGSFVSSIQPQFTRTADGLLLNAYQADYRTTPGNELTQLQVRIAYQTVDGFQLPARIEVNAVTKGNTVASELGLSDCKAKRG
jgi:hypothetical protein